MEREDISFWTMLSGPLLADLAPYEVGSLSISRVRSSLCSTTRNEALNVDQYYGSFDYSTRPSSN